MIDKKLGFEQKIGKASLASRMNILKSFLKVLKVCLKYNDYLKLSAIKSWDDQILHDILINLRIIFFSFSFVFLILNVKKLN